MLGVMGNFPNDKRDPTTGKFAPTRKAADGRLPLDIQAPSSPNPESTLGVGGTAVFGGYLATNEKNQNLIGRAKWTTFSDSVANVAILAAGVRLLLNLTSNATWKFQPADPSEEAAEMAKTVEGVFHGMRRPWHRIVRRLAGHRFFGFALGEWVAKRNDDGTIGYKDVLPLSQQTIERWILDRDGSVLGAVQTSPQTGKDVAIPREKMIHVVDDALSDSPEGLGLLRHVVDSVQRLQRLCELEIWGYAGDLRGIPLGRAPLAELDQMVKTKKITKAKADELLNGLSSFIAGHMRNPELGLLLDSTPYRGTGEQRTPTQMHQWDLELLDGGTYSLEAVAAAITRVQREIARVLGVEHLLLGENSSASRALSTDKTQSFGLLVDGTLREIREAVEQDLMPPLFELNGWDTELMPKIKTEAAAFKNADELSAVIRDLAVAGVQLDRQDEAVQEILDLMGLTRLAPLAEIDTDLLLSAEDAQAQAMEIMEAKAKATPDDGPPEAQTEAGDPK